jgi:hypothetical protein
MEQFEVEVTRETYRILFLKKLEALGGLSRGIAGPIFKEEIEKTLGDVASLPLDARREVLQQDTFISRVVSLDRYVERTGKKLLKGEQLSQGEREKIGEARAQLNRFRGRVPSA